MERRQFFGLVSGLVMMWPLVARAQRLERIRRIGVLMANIGPVAQSEVAAAAASSSAVEVNAAPVHAQDEIEGVIAAQAREPGGSIIVMPDPFNVTNSQQIILLTARYGVPAMYFTPTYFAESGGLVAYGSDFAEQFPQAAVYVDRILRGAKPAELPVQAPTKFDLVINLKTAKALGLDLSPSLLARAARVIE